jgi:hypothetical protein
MAKITLDILRLQRFLQPTSYRELSKNPFNPVRKSVVYSRVQTSTSKYGTWPHRFDDLLGHSFSRISKISGGPRSRASSRSVCGESPFHEPFQKFAMARAIDNTVYVAACNQVRRSFPFHFFGLSSIYGPDGNEITIANMNDQEEIIRATIDENWRQELKQTFYTMMNERRTDVY